MRSSSAADARPVRTELNSFTIVSTLLSIRRVPSSISSSMLIGSLRDLGGGDDRADPLSVDDPADVPVGESEDVDRKPVVHAEGERGRVHHLEASLDRLQVREGGQETRV